MWDSEQTQCARVWEQLKPCALRGPGRTALLAALQAVRRPSELHARLWGVRPALRRDFWRP